MTDIERFTLAPTSHEVVVNRSSDAADDLFSYAPETHAQTRSLGHLYVVGHTEQESGSVGYLVSLVAALAKREYYAQHPAGEAKAAFARTLRKINEVVEEFLKTNEVAIDVGIFAVAGSTLYVSRLGKFKILLARDGKTIDVFNNIALFEKEVVQKKRFSNVISGPVQKKDAFLAYFPQRAITSRERYLKHDLLTGSPQGITERLATVSEKSPSFSASLLYIDIDQVPVTDPSDAAGKNEPRLAWSPRQGRGASTAQSAISSPNDPDTETAPSAAEDEEVPHIIASEFTHRSRTNSFGRAVQSVRKIRLGVPGRAVILVVAALGIVGTVLFLKPIIFTSEKDQQLQTALDTAETALQSAHQQLADGDGVNARALVLDQLGVLRGLAADRNRQAQALQASFASALNDIDGAEPAAVSLVVEIPEDEGSPFMATATSGSASFWLLADAPEGDPVLLIEALDGAVADSVRLEQPMDMLIPAPPGILLLDSRTGTVMLRDGNVQTNELPTPDAFLSADWFLDYAYILTTSGILKVSDLETVKPVNKQWLNDVSELADGAARIAVDGDVWTLSNTGMLTKYYRGEKSAESQLPFGFSEGQDLLTTDELPLLYVSDTNLKRVYIIDKETLSMLGTVNLDTEQDIIDIFLGGQGKLHFLTGDGKVWRVQ